MEAEITGKQVHPTARLSHFWKTELYYHKFLMTPDTIALIEDTCRALTRLEEYEQKDQEKRGA